MMGGDGQKDAKETKAGFNRGAYMREYMREYGSKNTQLEKDRARLTRTVKALRGEVEKQRDENRSLWEKVKDRITQNSESLLSVYESIEADTFPINSNKIPRKTVGNLLQEKDSGVPNKPQGHKARKFLSNIEKNRHVDNDCMNFDEMAKALKQAKNEETPKTANTTPPPSPAHNSNNLGKGTNTTTSREKRGFFNIEDLDKLDKLDECDIAGALRSAKKEERPQIKDTNKIPKPKESDDEDEYNRKKQKKEEKPFHRPWM